MRWRDEIDWWTDPRLAYAAGLEDGYATSREDDEAAHRAAVRRVQDVIEQADRRAAADRGELAA